MKKKKNFDVVGCIVELGTGRRWASVRVGRARRARRAAGGRERAWRAGRAGARRASVLGRAGLQAHRRWRARARAGERQLGAGALQGSGRRALGAR